MHFGISSMHFDTSKVHFQQFQSFFVCFFLIFLQSLVDGPDSDFHISDSSWSPSAVRHTVRSAAKNDRQSCEFQPILWHGSKVMTKEWFWPTHFGQNQVAALSTYILILSKIHGCSRRESYYECLRFVLPAVDGLPRAAGFGRMRIRGPGRSDPAHASDGHLYHGGFFSISGLHVSAFAFG